MDHWAQFFGMFDVIIGVTGFALGGNCLFGKNGRILGGLALMLISVAIIFAGVNVLK